MLSRSNTPWHGIVDCGRPFFSTTLFLGRLRPAYLRGLLGWIEENANWLAGCFARGSVLPPGWAESTAQRR